MQARMKELFSSSLLVRQLCTRECVCVREMQLGGALFSYVTGCAKIKKKCICQFFLLFRRVSVRAIFLSSDDIKEALFGRLVCFSYSRPVALNMQRERVA